MEENLLPVDDLATDEELRRSYASVSVEPPAAPGWGYRLVLPKDWVRDDGPLTEAPAPERLAQVGLFAEADRAPARAAVQVWATLLPFEVNLTDWVEFYAEQAGMEILEGHIRDPETGSPVDAIARGMHDGRAVLTRLTAYSDGGRVFLVAAAAAEWAYESLSKTLALAAVSFEPAEPTGREFMEEFATYTDSAGRVSFMHPASWKVEELPAGPRVSGVALKLEGEEELLGYVRVQTLDAADGGSFENVLRGVRRDLAASGLDLDTLRPLEEEGAWGERLWVGDAYTEDETQDLCVVGVKPFVEGWGSEGVDGGGRPPGVAPGVACVLLSPSRERSPLVWMRDKRAFEFVIATARPAAPADA